MMFSPFSLPFRFRYWGFRLPCCLHLSCFLAANSFFVHLILSSSLRHRRLNLFLHFVTPYTTLSSYLELFEGQTVSLLPSSFLSKSPLVQCQSHLCLPSEVSGPYGTRKPTSSIGLMQLRGGKKKEKKKKKMGEKIVVPHLELKFIFLSNCSAFLAVNKIRI